MIALESLQHAMFADLVGQIFTLHTSAGNTGLVLAGAQLLGHKRTESHRDPFSLVFRGGRGIRVPQGIYRLECETLGAMEIFIAQVGDGAQGAEFEAIFT